MPLAALRDETVYAGAGKPCTPEWTDLAHHLFEGRGIEVAPPAPLAVGPDEFQRIMAQTRCPVLAVVGFPAMPRTVVRPLVEPVPLSPVSLVWRKGLVHRGLGRPARRRGTPRGRGRVAQLTRGELDSSQ
ncbi:hypothetical protein GCM10020256_47720 [Streptomyces thermocoprophilus]